MRYKAAVKVGGSGGGRKGSGVGRESQAKSETRRGCNPPAVYAMERVGERWGVREEIAKYTLAGGTRTRGKNRRIKAAEIGPRAIRRTNDRPQRGGGSCDRVTQKASLWSCV